MKSILFVSYVVFSQFFWGSRSFGATTPTATNEISLEQGFRREFSYLNAQIKQLQLRKKQIEEEHKKQELQSKIELDALRAELLQLQTQEFRQAQELKNLEKASGSIEEQEDLLRSTLQNAAQDAGITLDLSDSSKFGEISKNLFLSELEQIKASAQLQKVRGDFFLPSGTLAQGEMLVLGRLLAFGWNQEVAGPLAWTSAGKWQLVRDEGFIQGIMTNAQDDANLSFFLSDGGGDSALSKKPSKTPLEVVQSGGQIAWVIVALGFLALGFVFVRGFRLRSCIQRSDSQVQEFLKALRLRDGPRVQEIREEMRGSLRRLADLFDSSESLSKEQVEERVLYFLSEEESRMGKYGQAILVFAAVAPLLGLLGTVTGMIGTFEIITELGTGNPKMLSGGIGEALITTELGLIVAIPALLFGHFLSQWAQAWREELERTAAQFLGARFDRDPS